MKKIHIVLALLVIASMFMSACGGPFSDPTTGETGEVILDHTSAEAQAYCPDKDVPCVVTVDNRLTTQQMYDNCVAESSKYDPYVLSTDLGFDHEEYFPCGNNKIVDESTMWLVPVATFVKFTPIPHDDLVVYGLLIIKEVGTFVLVATTAVLAGEGIIYLQSHSNKEHNPNIKGTQARKNIELILAMLATAGCSSDPEKCRCGIIKVGDTIIRGAIWVADHTRPEGGYLTWFFNNAPGKPMMGPWGGSYNKTLADFNTYQPGASEIKKGWVWEPKDCNDPGFPKPPTFLQAAQ